MRLEFSFDGDPGGEFDRQSFSFPCPKCEFENDAEVGQVIRGDTVICRGCHADIHLQDENGQFAQARDEFNGFFDSMKKSFGG